MTRKQVFEDLNKIFRDVFDDDTIYITETTKAEDIEDWDSLEHVNLIIAIEHHFNMKFRIDEVNTMKNAGEIADKIMSRIK